MSFNKSYPLSPDHIRRVRASALLTGNLELFLMCERALLFPWEKLKAEHWTDLIGDELLLDLLASVNAMRLRKLHGAIAFAAKETFRRQRQMTVRGPGRRPA